MIFFYLPSLVLGHAGHSCEAQLLIVTDDFAKALNNRQQVDIGILDLSKAFDRVLMQDCFVSYIFMELEVNYLHGYNLS